MLFYLILEDTLDRSPVHHRDTHRQMKKTTILMFTLTPSVNLESPINLKCMFLYHERKPQIPGRNPCMHREYVKLNTEKPQP